MRAPNSGSRSLQRRGHPQCHSPLNEGAIPGMALSAAASLPGFDTGQRTANTCIARRRIGDIRALELLRRAQILLARFYLQVALLNGLGILFVFHFPVRFEPVCARLIRLLGD